jgi:hypothetical protein
MADVTQFDLTGGTAYANYTSASITTGTASVTIPCEDGKSFKMAVRIANGSGSTLTATFNSGATGGCRSSLGDYTQTIADGQTYYFNMSDTARFMNIPDQDIDLDLATAGTASLVVTETVQL